MAKKRQKKTVFNPKPRLMKGGKQIMGVREEMQKLQERMQELQGKAVDELRERRKEAAQALADIDKELSDLTGGKAPKSGITRKRDPNKPCPICGVVGHDGRFHRKDTVKKKR